MKSVLKELDHIKYSSMFLILSDFHLIEFKSYIQENVSVAKSFFTVNNRC